MKRRTRRGRGRGRRPPPATADSTLGSDLDPTVTPSPGLSEDTEVEEGSELTTDKTNAGNRTTETSDSGPTDSMDSAQGGETTANSPSSGASQANSAKAPAASSSSNSSVDGDGGSDGGDTERMHTGFMQTGPKNYRVGSTVVNLNNCSDDDMTPEFRHNDICLQVECGDNKALMYLSKLYQGSKGKCIELDSKWYTPNEYQAVSGRESAKDWKRSIRHHGRSLKLLLSRNVLDVHPAACRCDSCSQLQQLNGKSGTNNEATKAGSGGETSGEDVKKPCNGATSGKKRKKGKQQQQPPAPAAKMAKLTSANTTTIPASVATTAPGKVEPLGITIPKPEKPKEEEEKILEIPNLDSPLFKDVPAKKADSSSDSSSSSGGSSTSDDSSSSDDDSDDDDEEKKDVKVAAPPAKAKVVEEPAKPRTPIKLTISNVGKPSAKVTSTAPREPVESNSSDSDTDVEDNDITTEKEVKPLTNSDMIGRTKTSPTTNCSVNELKQETMESKEIPEKSVEKVPEEEDLPNHKEWKSGPEMEVDEVKDNTAGETALENSLLAWGKSASPGQNDPVSTTPPPVTDASIQSHKDSDMDIPANVVSKDLVSTKKEEQSTNEFQEKSGGGKAISEISDEVENSHRSESESQRLNGPMPGELNSASLRDSQGTKYCPDGFILAPTLSKSPQHLKTTFKISQNVTDTMDTTEVKEENETEEETKSKEEATPLAVDNLSKCDSENGESVAKDDSKAVTDNTADHVMKELADKPSQDLQHSTKDKVEEKVESKDDQPVRDSTEEVDDKPEPKDTNATGSDVNMNKSSEEKVTTPLAPVLPADKVSSDVVKPGTESLKVNMTATTAITRSKEAVATSLSSPKYSASKTSTTTPTTISTSGSGTITSPTAKASSSSKASGFTNGIPDDQNPFITWTKYDGDNSGPVNSSLPASSLVQALARAPFPPLALPGESPVSQISPLGSAVPQLSPLGLGLSPGSSQLARLSPGSQMPRLSSPTSQRLRSSPSHSSASQQQLSPPLSRAPHLGTSNGNKASHGEDSKAKSAPKSVKRTSRLSNIIDSLRTSKEKEQAAGSGPSGAEQGKKSALDALLGGEKKSPSLEQTTMSALKSRSSPVFSPSLSSEQRASSERLLRDSLAFQHQLGMENPQALRSSLDAVRAQAVNNSFNAFKDDLDKGKKMLESLEMMKNGLIDPYKAGMSDLKSRKFESSHSQNRMKPSSLSSSSSTAASSALTSLSSSSSSRPSSRQSSSKQPSSQSYLSASPSSSTSRTTATTTTSSSSAAAAAAAASSAMFQAAPSASLATAHMELNAVAANILAFQHMYGMSDPYLMKTLMSNPLYLQRMMEIQKQAMDPLMLRQLEMFEAAAAAEKTKNSKDQRAAAMQTQLLWQAQAASILHHQQMQQIQQIQLHQQQLQQQAAAVRERETRDTIAAIMASKSNSLNTYSSKSTGSISTGQSAKSVLASVSAASAAASNKRPRSAVPPSPSDLYSRDGPSLEKKLRSSHPASSQLSNNANYHHSSSSTPSMPSSSKHTGLPNKSASSSNSNMKPRSSSSSGSSGATPGAQPKHDFLDLQLSSPNVWGLPGLLQPPSVDMARMSRFFERPAETPPSSSSSAGHTEPETPGAEVLDLSVKPRTGKP